MGIGQYNHVDDSFQSMPILSSIFLQRGNIARGRLDHAVNVVQSRVLMSSCATRGYEASFLLNYREVASKQLHGEVSVIDSTLLSILLLRQLGE